MTDQLLDVYHRALKLCAPDALVERVADAGMPRDVVAIGKCAGPLLDGFARAVEIRDALVAIPEGYRRPITKCEVVAGGHPDVTEASLAAGRRVLEFAGAHDDVTFLISGGGSACVEQPLSPWFEARDVVALNTQLVASGIPIGAINCVRKHVSAIKGGRLAARVRGRSVTLVYSDVSDGALADVASGPTMTDATTREDAAKIVDEVARSRGGGEDVLERASARLRDPACPETVKHFDDDDHETDVRLIADNGTLTSMAAELCRPLQAVRPQGQMEGDVDEAACALYARWETLQPGQVLVAGGEPTVVRRGQGRGGRCTELAVRFALAVLERAGRQAAGSVTALFGSSDGVDGSSGAAGVLLRGIPSFDVASAREALERSDSAITAAAIGELIMMPPTGNNLRDLFLLART
jgi:hydroxypyruvate reductase